MRTIVGWDHRPVRWLVRDNGTKLQLVSHSPMGTWLDRLFAFSLFALTLDRFSFVDRFALPSRGAFFIFAFLGLNRHG